MTPVVSIITRTADRPACLERLLPKLQAAAPAGAEWIICDDAPSGSAGLDAFVARARTVLPFEVKIVRSRAASRPVAANLGLGAATGRYVHIHDDDDSVLPGFYERTTAFLDSHPEYGGAATLCDRIDEAFDAEGRLRTRLQRPHYHHVRHITLLGLATTQTIAPIAFVARRSAMAATGVFNEALPVCEDYEYFLRFLMQFDIAIIPDSLARFHVRSEMTGAYANSDASSRHAEVDAQFRNRLLRDDISANRFGLGALLALGEMNRPGWRLNTLLGSGRMRSMAGRLSGMLRFWRAR